MESKKAVDEEQQQNRTSKFTLLSTASESSQKRCRKTQSIKLTLKKYKKKGRPKNIISNFQCKKCSLEFNNWNDYNDHAKWHALEIDNLRIPLKPLTKKQLKKWTRKLKPLKACVSISSNTGSKIVFSRVTLQKSPATNLTNTEQTHQKKPEDLVSVKENCVSPVPESLIEEVVTSDTSDKQTNDNLGGLHNKDIEHFCDELVSVFNINETVDTKKHPDLVVSQEQKVKKLETRGSTLNGTFQSDDRNIVPILNTAIKFDDVKSPTKLNTIIVKSVTVPAALSVVGGQNESTCNLVLQNPVLEVLSNTNPVTVDALKDTVKDIVNNGNSHAPRSSIVESQEISNFCKPVQVDYKDKKHLTALPKATCILNICSEQIVQQQPLISSAESIENATNELLSNDKQKSTSSTEGVAVCHNSVVGVIHDDGASSKIIEKTEGPFSNAASSLSLSTLSTQGSENDPCMEKVKQDLRKILASASSSHRCEICHRTFKNSQALGSHLRSHQQPPSYSCTLCGRNFRLNSTLSRHLDVHRRILYCDKCKQFFHSNEELDTHIQQVHNEGALSGPPESLEKKDSVSVTMNPKVSSVTSVSTSSSVGSSATLNHPAVRPNSQTSGNVTEVTNSQGTDDDDVILIASQPPGSVRRIGNHTTAGSLPVIEKVTGAGITSPGNSMKQLTSNNPSRQQLVQPQPYVSHQPQTNNLLRFPANTSHQPIFQHSSQQQQQQMQQPMQYRPQQMQQAMQYRPQQMQQPMQYRPQQMHQSRFVVEHTRPQTYLQNQMGLPHTQQRFSNRQFQPRSQGAPQHHPHLANLLSSTTHSAAPRLQQNMLPQGQQTSSAVVNVNVPVPKPVPTPLLRNKELTIMPLNQPAAGATHPGILTITPVGSSGNNHTLSSSNDVPRQAIHNSRVSITPVTAARGVQIFPVVQQKTSQHQTTTSNIANASHGSNQPLQSHTSSSNQQPPPLPALIPIPPNRTHITIQNHSRENTVFPQIQTRPVYPNQHQLPYTTNAVRTIKQMVNSNVANILNRQTYPQLQGPQNLTNNVNQMINRHAFVKTSTLNSTPNIASAISSHQVIQPTTSLTRTQASLNNSRASNEVLYAGRYIPTSTYATNPVRMEPTQIQPQVLVGHPRFMNANMTNRMHAPVRYPASSIPQTSGSPSFPQFTSPRTTVADQSISSRIVLQNQSQGITLQAPYSQQSYQVRSYRGQSLAFRMRSPHKGQLPNTLPPPPPYQPPFQQATGNVNIVCPPPPLFVPRPNFERAVHPGTSNANPKQSDAVNVIDISESCDSALQTVQMNNPDIEALTCGICSSVFSDAEQLSRHLVTHAGDNHKVYGTQSPDVIFCSMEGDFEYTSINIKKESNDPATSEATSETIEQNKIDEISSSVTANATESETANADHIKESDIQEAINTSSPRIIFEEKNTELDLEINMNSQMESTHEATVDAVTEETSEVKTTGLQHMEALGANTLMDNCLNAMNEHNHELKLADILTEEETSEIKITDWTSLAVEGENIQTGELAEIEVCGKVDLEHIQVQSIRKEPNDATKLSDDQQLSVNDRCCDSPQQEPVNLYTEGGHCKQYESNEINDIHEATAKVDNVEWLDATWNESSDFICPVCDQPSSNLDSFREHLLLHQMMSEFHCTLCNVEFTDIEMARKHAVLHARKRKLPRNVRLAQAFKRQRLYSQSFFATCRLCKRNFGNFRLYQLHRSRCEKLVAENQWLAIPIIDLRSVSSNSNALSNLGISGFIPLTDLSNKSNDSELSTPNYTSSYAIPLLDTSTLHYGKIEHLHHLGIAHNLRLNRMMKLDEPVSSYDEECSTFPDDNTDTIADVLMEIVDTIVLEFEEPSTSVLPELMATVEGEMVQDAEVTVTTS